jgi:nucleotide-binding universal stress UspA family protein
MNILVPLDGSLLAEEAIAPAAALLRRSTTSGNLTLVRIINPGSVALDVPGFAPPITESVFQAALEGGQEYLAQVAARTPLHGIRVETIVQMGSSIAAALCQAAADLKVDLIVMTSHARTGVAHFALGSVAEAVMRSASMPTLILHKDAPAFPSIDRDEPLTILVPLDGTLVAEAALGPAVQLAAQMRGAIRLLRVLPAHQVATPADRMLANETQDYFAHLRVFIEGHGVPMHQTIAWGDIADQIVTVAQDYQTDLIAIATHGRTGLDRLREGSITLDILHHLATPLLVVHPSAEVASAPAPLGMQHGQPS